MPHRRGIEIFCRLFSTNQRPNVFVSDAWPAPATYHRPRCEHCDQRVGRRSEPLTSAPFRFHDAVVRFFDRCLPRTRNLAARIKHLAEFFSGRSWPKIWPGNVFFVFYFTFGTSVVKIWAQGMSKQNRNSKSKIEMTINRALIGA